MEYQEWIELLVRGGWDPRPDGRGHKSRCPAHAGEGRSLSSAEGDSGVVLKCWARECSAEEIAVAAGTETAALFFGGRDDADDDGGGWKPVTLADLARHTGVPEKTLLEFGLTEGEFEAESRRVGRYRCRAVRVPYFVREEDGSLREVAAKLRTGLGRSKAPKYVAERLGKGARAYGTWLLDEYRTTTKPFLLIGEGESDAWACRVAGLPYLGLPGSSVAGALRGSHVAGFQIVYVVEEPDAAGGKFAESVCRRLEEVGFSGNVRVVSPPDDLAGLRKSDPAAFRDVLRGLCARSRPPGAGRARDYVVFADEVEPEPLRFFLDPLIPRGALSILVGSPGAGKSYATMALAAAASRAADVPGCSWSSSAGSRVLVFAPEDQIRDVMVPRLMVCEGDRSRVGFVDFAQVVADGRTVKLADLGIVEECMDFARPDLVIFDPLVRFIGDVNMNSASEVASTLEPVCDLAQSRDVAILIVGHAPKGQVNRAADMIFGSVSFAGMVRSGIAARELSVGPAGKVGVLMHVKANHSQPCDPIRYLIEPAAEDSPVPWVGRFSWDGLDGRSPEEIVGETGNRHEATELERSKEFIRGLFEGQSRLLSRHVTGAAQQANISRTTLSRASSALGIKYQREGFGENSKVWWYLPPKILVGDDEDRPF